VKKRCISAVAWFAGFSSVGGSADLGRDTKKPDLRAANEGQRSDANLGVQTPPDAQPQTQILATSVVSPLEEARVPDGSINPRPVIADLGARTMILAPRTCECCGGAVDADGYEDIGEWCSCGGGDA